ncbi:toxin-antitoxin system, antitoxin component, Xre family [Cardiobacterium valvarum F0432]|nr:toxin-antitoxin system, antitoxin component, Xre family [Cardiobacterium valvarum F0432]
MMMSILLLDEADVQSALAAYLRRLRRQKKWSRQALAERSTVPAATIKKFELTGQISLRQFLLLWQCLDDLRRLFALAEKPQNPLPVTIAEVLDDDF